MTGVEPKLDRAGLALTCGNDRALQLFNMALGAFLSSNEDWVPYLEEACLLDSGFALAHCMMVRQGVFCIG